MAKYDVELIEEIRQALETAETVTVTRNKFGYEIDHGNRLAKYKRTTSLLGGIPKPALVPWGIKMVSNYALENLESLAKLPKKSALQLLKGSPYEYSDSRKDRGTRVHNAIEDMTRGDEIPEDLAEDERQCVEGVECLLSNRGSRVLASEIIGFNDQLMYAGTFDHWEIDRETGTTWLLDWKTSKFIYPENSLQMSAYQNFTHIILETKEIPNTDSDTYRFTGKIIPWLPKYAQRLAVVHVEPDLATMHPVQPELHEYLFEIFTSACTIKTYMGDVDTWKKRPRINVFEPTISFGGKLND